MEADAQIRGLVGELWFFFAENIGFSDAFISEKTKPLSIVRAICHRLDDADLNVRSAFFSLLYSLDPIVLLEAAFEPRPVTTDVIVRVSFFLSHGGFSVTNSSIS
jgi:hypothetical protein